MIGRIGLSEEIKDDVNDLDVALNYLRKKRDKVIDEVEYVNAWYSLQKKNTKEDKSTPNLSKLKEYEKIKNISDKDKLKALTENSIDISDIELEKEISYLRKNPTSNIRGKYFLQAMPKYLKEIFIDSNRRKERKFFSKKRKTGENIEDLLSDLSTYADTPECLMNYISTRL